MAEGIFHLVGGAIQLVLFAYEAHDKSKSEQKSLNGGRQKGSLSRFSPPSQYPRAVLISSSSMSFGNDCERLVNISYQTSQTFPTMMGTYADVSQYLRKELAKHYPDEYFHIIIGENNQFGFSVDDGQYFAEIEQDRYRILIFSTKQNSASKSDTHDANSEMKLKWN